jgi:hypothetical protein
LMAKIFSLGKVARVETGSEEPHVRV